MNTSLKHAVAAVGIFLVSVVLYSYPLYKKGYTPGGDYLNLIQARNYGLAGTYHYESDNGAFLSAERAGQEGVDTGMQNPFTPIIYGHLFKRFGFHPQWPPLIAVGLFGLANAVFFLVITRISTFAAGLVAGLASAVMPVMAVGAVSPGFYEWGMIFFAIGLWLYFASPRGTWHASTRRAIVATCVLALAALARNAFAVSAGAILLFDFRVHRSWIRSLAMAVPLIAIFGLTLTPYSWLGTANGYDVRAHQPLQQIGHFFNDPYTYYYDREAFVKTHLGDPAFMDRIDTAYAARFGYPVALSYRLKAYRDAFSFYLGEGFALTNIGGPIILLLCAWGLVVLRRKDRRLFEFCIFWPMLLLAYLVLVKSGNWDHFMEIIFVPIFLLGVSVQELSSFLVGSPHRRRFILAIVAAALLGHLAYAAKWRFHDTYESSKASQAIAIADVLRDTPSTAVIAMGIHDDAVYRTAYASDRTIVYFNADTIERLSVAELKHAFETYRISLAVGFEPDEAAKIQRAAPAVKFLSPLP